MNEFINVHLESEYIVVDVKSLSGILPKKSKFILVKLKLYSETLTNQTERKTMVDKLCNIPQILNFEDY